MIAGADNPSPYSLTRFRLAMIALLNLLCSACATIDGPANPDDPLESFNRSMFAFNDTVDEVAFKPLAQGYNFVMPDVASKGVTNFFNNVDDIVVLANQLLQFKFAAAAQTSARLVFNTTFGLLGLIDVASDMDLPKANEDFGQTLAVWGVDSGPYLVLPLIGPRTVRDTAGLAVDWSYFDPVFNRQTPQQSLVTLTIKYVDVRAGLLKASDIIDDTVPDRYAFVRDAWLTRREFLIYDGKPPLSEDDFSEEELFKDEDLFGDDDLFEDKLLEDTDSEADKDTLPAEAGSQTPEQRITDPSVLQEPAMRNNMEIMVRPSAPPPQVPLEEALDD